MKKNPPSFELIETDEGLRAFAAQNAQTPWLCFDTEFVGEKRFTTLICLIQVVTPLGCYLIDSIAVKNLKPFLDLIADPAIRKVTHAGENDYRLLYLQFGVLPRNVFDIQVAAGFIGYKYPTSYAKLVEGEMQVTLDKAYAVTDWEARPFNPRQLTYALDDVLYLPELSQKIQNRLKALGRLDWAMEEISTFEQAAMYDRDPNREALMSNLMPSLKPKEQILLLRLYHWRNEEARRLNYSKEMIFPAKMMGILIRAIASGKDALLANRRLPQRTIQKHGNHFWDLFSRPATPEEQEVLGLVAGYVEEDPEHDLIMEMLHLLIRYRCNQEEISIDLVLPRGVLKKLKADENFFDPSLSDSWRKAFLGEELIDWIKHRHHLRLEFKKGSFELTYRENGLK
ncbi:MAG: HRDC domain-containing protein [Saprospirales bacterium]|nr:HRDC domain-containing protein [Saprospirales bacterium]MBK7338429.1 HRDC domain-containing protein [Saprospirales bacterium]